MKGILAGAVIALLIFITDLYVPRDVAMGALYVLAIWPVFSAGARKYLIAAAVLATFLVIIGLLFSPAGNAQVHNHIANLILELVIIWTTAILFRRILALESRNQVRIEDAEKLADELEELRKQDKREQRAMASIMEDLRIEKAKLLLSDRRFRDTLNSAPVAMVLFDRADKSIAEINEEALELFDYTKNEVAGAGINTLLPESFERDLLHDEQDLPGSTVEIEHRDFVALRKGGDEFPVELGWSRVDTEEGNFILVVIVDVTGRRKIEEAQRRLKEELEKRVKERTAELAETNEALERSNVELKQFAYVASHDLQTPLRSIANFSEFLNTEYYEQFDDTARHYLDRIKAGVKRMETLINDLLLYSRVESRGKPLADVDVNKIVEGAIELLSFELEQSGGKITKSDLPIVKGDVTQLNQLFENLIGNSIKYRGDKVPDINIDAKEVDDFLEISISDNGIGIAEEHFDRIFEIFKRLHTEKEYPGTGIGLAVCRRIMARHYGTIRVESEPGKGTTFIVSFPVSKKK